MADPFPFPAFIRTLPAPNTAPEITAHIARSEEVLTMFFETEEPVEVPEHAHGPQWGVVLRGQMEMTISGVKKTYKTGDTYFVPDGAPHIAQLHAGYAGIDVFADTDRFESFP